VEQKTPPSTEVNRLYWETEKSVAEIANQMSVSRRALYELIEPLASGMQCSRCGAELYYSNRSAKAAGIARCLICGNEKELDPDISHEDVGMIPPYDAGLPKAARRTAGAAGPRATAIVGFAIAGVVVGAIATLLIKRKS